MINMIGIIIYWLLEWDPHDFEISSVNWLMVNT